MCGDPLRAEYIAKNYLTDTQKVTEVRNMYGFTGKYDGKDVTVMGHGMGMPSIGIYTYELFNFYNVDSIIRIGSAGGLADDVNLRELVIGMAACTDSNFAWQYELPGTFAPIADFSLLQKAVASADKLGIQVKVGNILSTDVFYSPKSANEKWRSMGVLAVEMEAAALYMNAAKAGKKALCICTISDHLFKPEKLSVEERQTGFDDMIKTALGML
jgi:purine-nucleoside phosphorylase